MITTPSMGLKRWDQPNDIFSYVELSDNFALLDAHDHTSGKGVQIPTAGLANLAVDSTKLATDAVTSGKIATGAVISGKLATGAVGETNLSTTLAGKAVPSFVTSLPGSPFDGQEIYLQANGTAGVVWHLRYRSASASAYKWEFIGGAHLNAAVPDAEIRTAGTSTYGDLATVGPSVTIPSAGDYDVAFHGSLSNTIANRSSYATVVGPGIVASDTNSSEAEGFDDSVTWLPWSGRHRLTFNAGGTVKLQYRSVDTANTAQFENRKIWVVPVRIG